MTPLLVRPRTLFGLIAIYAASRLLGLAREIGVAVLFGTTSTADRLTASFVVASVVGVVGGEALYSGAVRSLGAASTDAARTFEERYADVMKLGRQAAIIATFVFALIGPMATLLIVGPSDAMAETVLLSLLLAPSVGSALLIACVNARLTIDRRFALLNGAPMLYSLGALAGIGLLTLADRDIGSWTIAAGWSAGNVAAAVVLMRRVPPSPTAGRTPRETFTLLRFGLPLAVAYSLIGLQSLTGRAVASRLETGAVAALAYADRVFLLPIGFVLAAVGPIVLGGLVTQRARESSAVPRKAASQLGALTRVILPLSLLFAAFSPLVIRFLFEYGKFDAESSDLTNEALDGLAIGVGAVAATLVLFRMMQALADLRGVVQVALAAAGLNIVLTIGGGVVLGLFGVTLATSLVALLVLGLQIDRLGRHLGAKWSASMRVSVALPIVLCFATALAVVGAAHAGALAELERILLLTASATIAAVWLWRR